MDDFVYNEELYVPPSDNEESGDENYFVLQPVALPQDGQDIEDTVSENEQTATAPPSPPDSPARSMRPSSPDSPPSSPDSPGSPPHVDSDSDQDFESLSSSPSSDEEDGGHLPPTPVVPWAQDTEHIDDFALGWEWLLRDTGASTGPFTGSPGLKIRPDGTKPVDFFNLLFEEQMYHLIAEETNRYANTKQQGKYFHL